MRFLVITFAPLLKRGEQYFSYAPYVREMEIWLKYAEEIAFCCPTYYTGEDLLVAPFSNRNFTIFSIPELAIKDVFKPGKLLKTIKVLFAAMQWADHIHLRCPGNVGLIGCFVQILFPHKKKTAKYAGNWDWNNKQPWSYRLQQRILRDTFLTRNMTALVYGNWPDQTKNIKPFFTASYSEKDRTAVSKSPLNQGIKLAFIGTLTENKSPLRSLEVLKELSTKKINATLTFCGDGPQRELLISKIAEYGLEGQTSLLGNVDGETVKRVLQDAHFLIFISRSEGWPKAVAESMWWKCLPITTAVSCVPQMLGNGDRGNLVNENVKQISAVITGYISNQTLYHEKCEKAMAWSREFTLERFEDVVKKLL